MTKGIAAILTLTLLAGCAGPKTAMFRADPQHSGRYQTAGITSLHQLRWKFSTDGEVKSTPVLVGGSVLFGSQDGHLYAVSTATGIAQWKYTAGGAIQASPPSPSDPAIR